MPSVPRTFAPTSVPRKPKLKLPFVRTSPLRVVTRPGKLRFPVASIIENGSTGLRIASARREMSSAVVAVPLSSRPIETITGLSVT